MKFEPQFVYYTLLAIFLVLSTNACAEDKHVVILGAGAAGIAAATRLYENGIRDILILEAENRYGGRVNTINVENGFVEMGAQWIHGVGGNVVYELASARNLVGNATSEGNNGIYARSSGEIIEPELAKRLNEILIKLFDEHSEEDDSQHYNSTGEFYTHVILDKEFRKVANADIPEDLKEEFIEICHHFVNVNEGSETWFDIGISTFREYEDCEGDLNIKWNKVGFNSIINILMDKSMKLSHGSFETDVIALNSEVEQISLQDDGSGAIVTCSNGRVILADHVIVTASVGVLRETYKSLFKNFSFPDSKLRSINNLGFGTVDKIYLEFSKPWWPVESGGFNLLWTKSDREEYVQKGLEWVVGISSVSTVDFAPNMLCGWLTGTAARTMESLDENFVSDTVMQVLRKFLSKKFEIPDVIRIIRSTWYSNKHFRGSYSYIDRKTEANNASAYDLSVPIVDRKGNPVLLFAGEATSPHHHSTVHGAIESGWNEADRLIKVFKKNNN